MIRQYALNQNLSWIEVGKTSTGGPNCVADAFKHRQAEKSSYLSATA